MENRPHTRCYMSSIAEREKNTKIFTEDDIVIIQEFDTIITHSTEKALKEKLINLKDLFQANTLEKQNQLDLCDSIAIKLTPQIDGLSKELKEIRTKFKNLESEKEYLSKESEEQISKLSEENKTQKITMENQIKHLEFLKLLIEEKEGIIKLQNQEIEGLNLTIETMKNTLDKKSKYNYLNYYSTGYNSSFDVSNIMESGNVRNSSIIENDTTRENGLNRSNSKQEDSSNENIIALNTKTKTLNKSPIQNNAISLNRNNIQNLEESVQQYFTPEIRILNKSLQNELETQGIINKKQIIKSISDKNNFDEIVFAGNTVESRTNARINTPDKLQEQINDLKERNQMNTLQITKIMELLNTKTNTNLSNDIHPIKHKKCYLIGDLHLEQIKEGLEKNEEITKEYEIKSNIQPKNGIQSIEKTQIPENVNKEDLIIISGGTNDLYRTKPNEIIESLKTIINLPCTTILLSIPPQNCLYTNKDIRNLNTSIKRQMKQYNNLHIINTHKVVKIRDLEEDGITISPITKKWVTEKIIKTINYTFNKTIIVNEKDQPNLNNNNQRKQYSKNDVNQFLSKEYTDSRKNERKSKIWFNTQSEQTKFRNHKIYQNMSQKQQYQPHSQQIQQRQQQLKQKKISCNNHRKYYKSINKFNKYNHSRYHKYSSNNNHRKYNSFSSK